MLAIFSLGAHTHLFFVGFPKLPWQFCHSLGGWKNHLRLIVTACPIQLSLIETPAKEGVSNATAPHANAMHWETHPSILSSSIPPNDSTELEVSPSLSWMSAAKWRSKVACIPPELPRMFWRALKKWRKASQSGFKGANELYILLLIPFAKVLSLSEQIGFFWRTQDPSSQNGFATKIPKSTTSSGLPGSRNG